MIRIGSVGGKPLLYLDDEFPDEKKSDSGMELGLCHNLPQFHLQVSSWSLLPDFDLPFQKPLESLQNAVVLERGV